MSTVATHQLGTSNGADADAAARELARRLLRPHTLFAAAVLLIAFVAMFWQVLDRQAQISATRFEDWGHAFLVPIISGFLVWQSRERLARVRPRVFWPALPVVLLAIVVYFQSVVLVRSHFPQGLSMLLAAYGSALLLLGPGVLRHLFLPIAFLVFGITLPEKVMYEITFQLQMVASQGAWVMLSVLGAVLGFETLAEGNVLTMLTDDGRELPLNVAEACSGMRMVVAFYALAAGFALGACREWWQRIALILLAAPIAVLMNIVRVAVLGLLSLVDPNLADGNAHTVIGTILLFPSIALFFGVVAALNKIVQPDAGAKGASA